VCSPARLLASKIFAKKLSNASPPAHPRDDVAVDSVRARGERDCACFNSDRVRKPRVSPFYLGPKLAASIGV
jgi:hypothetical protein